MDSNHPHLTSYLPPLLLPHSPHSHTPSNTPTPVFDPIFPLPFFRLLWTNNHLMALNIASVLQEKARFLSKEETNSMNDMAAIIVLDGIAVVDEVKAKKLTLFLLKKIQPFGAVVRNDIFIPMDPSTNLSLG